MDIESQAQPFSRRNEKRVPLVNAQLCIPRVESQLPYLAAHRGQDAAADEFFPCPRGTLNDPVICGAQGASTRRLLAAGHNPWVRLVEVKRAGGADENDTIVFDAEVELSQSVVCDIHPVERVSVSFGAADSTWPEVLALRTDFPYVPHLNLRDTEFPRSPCLYEDNYAEQKLRWTAMSVVARVHDWLRDTAAGMLHGQDQPLERRQFSHVRIAYPRRSKVYQNCWTLFLSKTCPIPNWACPLA
jgi:hypothetical protein